MSEGKTGSGFALQYLKDSGMSVNITISRDDLECVIRKIVSEAMAENKAARQELLPKGEVCKRLGVSDSTLWKWDKVGYLKRVKIGRSVFYNSDDIKKISSRQ